MLNLADDTKLFTNVIKETNSDKLQDEFCRPDHTSKRVANVFQHTKMQGNAF